MGKKLRFFAYIVIFVGLLVVMAGLKIPTALASNSSEPHWNGLEYEVDNVQELQWMNNDSDNDYVLTSDIDATETQSWNSGNGFDPIGDSGDNFKGSFDGNGYIVENLYIDRSSTDHIGLFGYTDSVAVIDLKQNR